MQKSRKSGNQGYAGHTLKSRIKRRRAAVDMAVEDLIRGSEVEQAGQCRALRFGCLGRCKQAKGKEMAEQLE